MKKLVTVVPSRLKCRTHIFYVREACVKETYSLMFGMSPPPPQLLGKMYPLIGKTFRSIDRKLIYITVGMFFDPDRYGNLPVNNSLFPRYHGNLYFNPWRPQGSSHENALVDL